MGEFCFEEDRGPLIDPDALCDGCGVRGTVSRARRLGEHNEELELHRFCASCWAEEGARLQARWKEQDRVAHEAWIFDGAPRPPSRGATFGSATWHLYLELVERLVPAIRRGEVDDAYLTQLAQEMQQSAAWRVGRMPIRVLAFIQQYGAAHDVVGRRGH